MRRQLAIAPAEAREAVLLAWLAASVALGTAAAAALAAPEQAVLRFAARCETPGGHPDRCALCGMTQAFLAARKGELREARQANAASLPLFSAFALNEALMGFVMIHRMRHGWRKRTLDAAAARTPGSDPG